MRKKILIVSGYFYPENTPRAFRTTELVKEFARQGHDVTVCIPKDDNLHVKFEKQYNVVIQNIGNLKLPDIDIAKGNKYIIFIKRVVKRILLQLIEYPDIGLFFQVKRILKAKKGYDLMISIAAPHPIHWGVAMAMKNNKDIAKIWVADCGDPFMGATLDSFKKMFYFKYIEKFWCEKADFISLPFKGAKDGYYKEFHDKVKIIPQGFDFKELENIPNKNLENIIVTFAYAGGIIPARDPKYFIEYLLSLDIDFKFIFYTNNINYITPYLELSKGKIEVKKFRPRIELLRELKKMDFLINFDNDISTQLPSKLIDYYLTKRPILSIRSNDFDIDIVNQFLNKNYEKQLKINNPEQYRIENVSQKFLKLIS